MKSRERSILNVPEAVVSEIIDIIMSVLALQTFGFIPDVPEQTSSRKQSLNQLDVENLQLYDDMPPSPGLPVCRIKTGKYYDSDVHVKVITRGI